MQPQPSNSWSVQLLTPAGANIGAAVTLASLGIEDFQINEEGLGEDVGTFTVGGENFDAATIWTYGQNLAIINPSGVRDFVGRVDCWSREANGSAQNHIGRIFGPMWYLKRCMYQQRYSITTGNYPVAGQKPNNTYQVISTPRIVLNVLFNGINGTGFYSATTGQQLADAINWAITQGAPVALGVTDPATLPFSEFKKGVYVAEVIELMFRREPDFIVDWDYTTLPFPTIHFRKLASLKALVIDLTDTSIREALTIKERPDWQRSYVRITYDQTNKTPQGQFLATYTDWYSAKGQGNATNGVASGAALPNDIESTFRGVDLFCDLTGSAVNQTNQTASFASTGFSITDLATWQRWKPSLTAATVANAQILLNGFGADASRPAPAIATVDELDANGNVVAYDATCTNEVVDGQWADWIPGVNAQRVRATAWVKITKPNGDVHYEQLTKEMTAVNVNTNGISTAYIQSATNITQYSEPVPAGLAKSMWTSWQNLAIEGTFVNVEAFAGLTTISRSNCLNFKTAAPGVNGAPNWTAVNALVQSRRRTIKTGTMRVQFGAPLKITGHDLIDLVRATRYRVTTIDLGYLFGGPLGGGNANITHPRKTHARHTEAGGDHQEVLVVSKAVNPVAGTDPSVTIYGASGIQTWQPAAQAVPTVTMDPSAAQGSDGKWHPLGICEQKVCVNIGGVLKQRSILVLASGIYQGNGDPN